VGDRIKKFLWKESDDLKFLYPEPDQKEYAVFCKGKCRLEAKMAGRLAQDPPNLKMRKINLWLYYLKAGFQR